MSESKDAAVDPVVGSSVPLPEESAGEAAALTATDDVAGDDGASDVIDADDTSNLEEDSAFEDDSQECKRLENIIEFGNYEISNGRRYHAYRDGTYLLPNDDAEQDRLDLHHHVFNLAFDGRLVLAPIKNPQRVLDVGTGTGIWAIDFADLYPESHVIGCDLSPIQPGWIPPNLEFEVDDIEDTWRHNPFSYIHMRSLGGAIKDWPKLLQQAYDNLQPGGWLELVEFEVLIRVQNESEAGFPPMTKKWQENLHDAGERIGRSFEVATKAKQWLIDTGFEEVTEEIVKVPDSPWPRDRRQKEIGVYQQQNMLDASGAYGQAHFTRVLGWSKDEYDIMSATVRKELKDKKYHIYSNLYGVFGRKPKA